MSTHPRLLACLLAALAVTVVSSCSADEDAAAAELSGQWGGFVGPAGGEQVESYASLDDLVEMSDVVVRGRVVDVAEGRSYEGTPGDVLTNAHWMIEGEILAGERLDSRPSEPLVMEVFVGDERPPEGEEAVDPFAADPPPEEAIFFLRNIGAEVSLLGTRGDPEVEREFYRLVTFESVVVNVEDDAVNPAAAAGDDSPEAAALADLASFDEVARRIARLGG